MTVRRSAAPLVRQCQLAAALQTSREALTDLEGRLDALLSALRGSKGPGAASAASVGSLRSAADRVSGATRDAGAALAQLSALSQPSELGALARRS